MENPIILFSRKLLAPMSIRVPLEVQEVFGKLAESQGCDRKFLAGIKKARHCRSSFKYSSTTVARLNATIERQKAEMVVMQVQIDSLTANW